MRQILEHIAAFFLAAEWAVINQYFGNVAAEDFRGANHVARHRERADRHVTGFQQRQRRLVRGGLLHADAEIRCDVIVIRQLRPRAEQALPGLAAGLLGQAPRDNEHRHRPFACADRLAHECRRAAEAHHAVAVEGVIDARGQSRRRAIVDDHVIALAGFIQPAHDLILSIQCHRGRIIAVQPQHKSISDRSWNIGVGASAQQQQNQQQAA